MKPSLVRGRQVAALSVAGSDSGGNAGIQADIRAFHSFGVHACTAIAALTAQNPEGVFAVSAPEPSFVARQIEVVLDAYEIGGAKTGMLATAPTVRAVAGALGSRVSRFPLVVDPVMVATSGARLLENDAAAAMLDVLLPVATIATPNIPEAEALSGTGRIATRSDMTRAARAICASCGCAILLKGGHRTGDEALDLLWTPDRGAWWLSTPVVEAPLSTHGTGCSLSSALAAALALGMSLDDAASAAKGYVYGAIANSVSVGPRSAVLGFSNPADFSGLVIRQKV